MERFTMGYGPSPEVQRYQERRKAALVAAAAMVYNIPPPLRTPLEREAAREAETIYRERALATMRARAKA